MNRSDGTENENMNINESSSESERENKNIRPLEGEKTKSNEKTKSGEKNAADKAAPLTRLDGILAILYVIVLVVGITLCLSHGRATTVFHVIAVTACLIGITALKFGKYRGALRTHVPELVFLCALSACSLVAMISWIA